jgi:hypothetical protein
MVATKKLGKPDLVSREPQKILGAFFARQANNSEPAGVKVTKVPDSCILSQPRSIASLRPAPYSAGLPRSRNRNGSLISRCGSTLNWLDRIGDFEDSARGFFRVGIGAGGGVHAVHSIPFFNHWLQAVKEKPPEQGRLGSLTS